MFDREGRVLGQTVMPARSQPGHFTDDVICGVARPDFDVQHDVRLRVVRRDAT